MASPPVVHPSPRDYRDHIVATHPHGAPVPPLPYEAGDHEVWKQVFQNAVGVAKTLAASEYLDALAQLCYPTDEVPQLQHISSQIERVSGWKLHPVGGLITEEEFFRLLAKKLFPATVHVRSNDRILFSPEPDLCHELLGHAPWFLVEDVANVTERLAKAYVDAASPQMKEAIKRVYFWTLEVGLTKQPITDGKGIVCGTAIKVVGSGILSSAREIQSSVFATHKHKAYNFHEMVTEEVDTTAIQSHYYVAESVASMCTTIHAWIDNQLQEQQR